MLSRNAIVWIGVSAIAFGLWFFAARIRLHMIDPLTFIAYVAVAALGLTVLFWWGMSEKSHDDKNAEQKQENR